MCWASTRGPLKSKGGNETANANSSEWKIFEKFTNGYGERVLQRWYAEKSWKNTMLITIPRIRLWKRQWSSGSVARLRTICGRCLRSMAITIDELPRFVSDYNACKHRTVHATRRRNSRDHRKTFGHSVQRDKDPGSCKSSDSSVSKYKKIFEKGYTPNWTTEMFTIVKVQCTNPVTYNIYLQY